jgi:hypothetical protein
MEPQQHMDVAMPQLIGDTHPGPCKAAAQGEEAARCLDQGLPAERLYYEESGDEETDGSSDSESDMEEELYGEEESDSEAEEKRCAERRLLRKKRGALRGTPTKRSTSGWLGHFRNVGSRPVLSHILAGKLVPFTWR